MSVPTKTKAEIQAEREAVMFLPTAKKTGADNFLICIARDPDCLKDENHRMTLEAEILATRFQDDFDYTLEALYAARKEAKKVGVNKAEWLRNYFTSATYLKWKQLFEVKHTRKPQVADILKKLPRKIIWSGKEENVIWTREDIRTARCEVGKRLIAAKDDLPKIRERIERRGQRVLSKLKNV